MQRKEDPGCVCQLPSAGSDITRCGFSSRGWSWLLDSGDTPAGAASCFANPCVTLTPCLQEVTDLGSLFGQEHIHLQA